MQGNFKKKRADEMKTTCQFVPGMEIKSNTDYRYDKKECHIYLENTQVTDGAAWSNKIYSPADQHLVHTAFVLDHLENITFDLGGTKLIFHGRILPFMMKDCRNITFKNFSIDYDRYFYTEMEILDVDIDRLRLRVGDAYPFMIRDDALVAVSDTWESDTSLMNSHIIPIDPEKKLPLRNVGFMLYTSGNHPFIRLNPPKALTPIHFKALQGREIEMKFAVPEGLQAGNVLSMAHEDRRKPAFDAVRVQNLTIDNIRIHHIGSGGIIAYSCHNIMIHKLQTFLDKESKGLICANADAIHCFNCDGIITVDDCRIENIFDDTINVHGIYIVFDSVIDSHVLKAKSTRSSLSYHIPIYQPGDVLRAFKGKTQETLGDFTIQEVLNDDTRNLVFQIKESLDNLKGPILFENMRMPELHVSHLITGNKYRAILPSTGAKIVIEDSVFHHCPTAINLTGDSNYWYESGPVQDITIRNCRFTAPGADNFAIVSSPIFTPTEKKPYYHHNVNILDNQFELPSGNILAANYTENIRYKNNTSIVPEHFEIKNCATVRGIETK